MDNTPLTPRQVSTERRKRLLAALAQLPERWIDTFIHFNPEYGERRGHLNNVGLGKSLDENVIIRLEDLAAKLTKIKKQK